MGLAVKMESPHPPWPENQRPTPPSHQPAPHLLSHQSLVSKTKPFPPSHRRARDTELYRRRLLFCFLLPLVTSCLVFLLNYTRFFFTLLATLPCTLPLPPQPQVHACSLSQIALRPFVPPPWLPRLHHLRSLVFRPCCPLSGLGPEVSLISKALRVRCRYPPPCRHISITTILSLKLPAPPVFPSDRGLRV